MLSFGGPPVFKPSAWEWTFRSMNLKDSDPDRARALLEEGLEAWPDSPSLKYGLACWNALHGDKAAAMRLLGEAIAREPKTREWAKGDEDFSELREEPEFKALVDG